jgi:hypothetical protein
MVKKSHWIGLALCLGATASMAATCTSTKDLGGLGPPDVGLFGTSFSKVGSYVDCFTFSLGGSATTLGGVLEIDPLLNKLNIDVKSVSLYSSDSTTAWQTDTTPLFFNFGGLVGGGIVYTLQVASSVTSNWLGDSREVGYSGKIVTLASAAPEPSAYALAIVGLAVVGAGVLRARRR